jgi:glycosyltransferase involved in cell wall biosynthesis
LPLANGRSPNRDDCQSSCAELTAISTAPLKIALVVDHFLPRVGGIELHVADLARQLAARGQQVHVISTTPGPSEIDGLSVRRLCGPLLPHFQILYRSPPFAELRRLLESERYDVVHCHSSIVSPLSYGATWLARELQIPSVLTSHSLLGPHQPLFRLVNSLVQFMDWCTRLTAVSGSAAAVLQRLSGRSHVGVLANGIERERWQMQPVAHGRLRVTSVMRLNVKKRPQDLVAMVPRIKRQLSPELQPLFTIVGDGPVRRRLERQAGSLGVAGDIEFRGFLSREKIREIFAETDVFVLPTEHEAFGLAVLEARCAGLPVVARSGCGVADIIEHGRHGYLAHNRRQMADYIAQLIREHGTRRRMREAASVGLDRFGWDAVIARHLDEYREAATAAAEQRAQRLSA